MFKLNASAIKFTHIISDFTIIFVRNFLYAIVVCIMIRQLAALIENTTLNIVTVLVYMHVYYRDIS